MVDPAAEKVLSAKRYADLLLASARLDGDRVVITLPDGTEHASDDPGVHDALSDWLGMDVRLEPPPADEAYPMEMYTGHVRRGHAALRLGRSARHAGSTWPTPTGSPPPAWRRSPASTPTAQWDVRRFRPNGLIESRRRTGYPEEGWPTFELGEVAGGGADAHHAVLDALAGPAGARSGQGDRHHDPGREQQQPGRLRQGDQERNGPGGR